MEGRKVRNLSQVPGERLALACQDSGVCIELERLRSPVHLELLHSATHHYHPQGSVVSAGFGSRGVLEPTGPQGGRLVMKVPHIVYMLWLCVCYRRAWV